MKPFASLLLLIVLLSALPADRALGSPVAPSHLATLLAPQHPRSVASQALMVAPPLQATGVFTIYLPLAVQPAILATPVIASFIARPANIAPGASSTLRWSVSGATSLRISPGIGAASGTSVVVTPTTTIEYTLAATNAAGTSLARTTLVVTGGGNGAKSARLFTPSSTNVADTSLAVDQAGGLHATYSPIGGSVNHTPGFPVQYLFCPTRCADAASWASTEIGDAGLFGGRATLALDAHGHPRLLWFQKADSQKDGHYVYAACDARCTSAAGWTVVTLPMTEYTGPSTGRYFALDPQGRPRFVYTDTDTAGAHIGTFYAFCDSDCTAAASWREGTLADAYLLLAFSLAYDAGGRLHMAYSDATSPTTRAAYATCAAACEVSSNWAMTTLPTAIGTLGTGYDLALRLDSQGRPRMALAPGFFSSGPPSDLLFYTWCDSACTTAESWHRQGVGLPKGYGGSVDLVIDAQDRPRVAYRVNATNQGAPTLFGLGYAWCVASCETSAPNWNSVIVENADELNAVAPVPPNAGCSLSIWVLNEGKLALAVDPSGNTRISYIAKHVQGGSCSLTTDRQIPRLALLTQP